MVLVIRRTVMEGGEVKVLEARYRYSLLWLVKVSEEIHIWRGEDV